MKNQKRKTKKEKTYTLSTKHAAFIMGVTPESFRVLYSSFLDRKKVGVKVFFNEQDIKEASQNKSQLIKAK